MLTKLLLLALVVFAMVAIWYLQQFLIEKIRPKDSFYRFLLFLVVQVMAILFIILLLGSTIIYFKDFFFKR